MTALRIIKENLKIIVSAPRLERSSFSDEERGRKKREWKAENWRPKKIKKNCPNPGAVLSINYFSSLVTEKFF